MVKKIQSWQLFALYIISCCFDVQNKTPRFSRMVGASVRYFNITWAVATVSQCNLYGKFNMSIFAISFRKGGAVKWIWLKLPPPWSDIYTILPDAESLLGSLLHLWRLRTPSTSNRTYCDIYKFLRTINLFTKLEQNKVFVLAALKPICSCALLPFCYLIFKGHGMRSASSQVNSKCSKFHPVGVCINLPLPRLSTICG